MNTQSEFVGTVHIFRGPFRGNPIGLYLRREGDSCSIAPTLSPWNGMVGVGETVNKAAAAFDAVWKAGVAAETYSGPHWEGGIKPDKPKPPPKPPTAADPLNPVSPSPPTPGATATDAPSPSADVSEHHEPAAPATASPIASAQDGPTPSGPASEPAKDPPAG